MGLSMRIEKGQFSPALTCDTCGKPIEDLNGAIVVYRPPTEDSIVAAKVYHKRTCDPRGDFSEELRNYFPWLVWNHEWGTKGTNERGDTITLDVPKPLAI